MPKSWTRTQVCEALGVSPKSLYSWERDGKIPKPQRDRRGWRVYTPEDVAAIRRFLGETVSEEMVFPVRDRRMLLEGLSARNQLRGTVVLIRCDGVLCEVVLQLGDGQEVVSVVTRVSVERMGLQPGDEATAVIKSTEVMLFR